MTSLAASLHALSQRPEIARLLMDWQTLLPDMLVRATRIQSISAPTFAERDRAAWVTDHFGRAGLLDLNMDDIGSVFARTPGADPARPAVMVSAHLDTVFPIETDLRSVEDVSAGRITGPGIGDNSLGVAALVGLAHELSERHISPSGDIWWVATVGEEGLGDLRGMRRACQTLGDQLGMVIVLEGMGLGRVYHAGLGVRRLRVDVSGPGGHSWLHRSRPSAVHHLLQLGAQITHRVRPPANPPSSLNIGLISGGTTINTVAAQASLSIDLRSEDPAALARMEGSIRRIVNRALPPRGIDVQITRIGDRPAAALPVEHPLVSAAQEVLQFVGWSSALEIGSTDANIPLALGVPAVCIGITTGADAHTTGEYIETAPIPVGMRQLTLLTLLASESAHHWHNWHATG